jgi:hypothetical protein
MSSSLRSRVLLSLAPLAAAVLAACGEEVVLPPAQIPVAEQEIRLYALSGTPVNTMSGYSMLSLLEVRLDRTNDFDFAFEIAPDSALGLGTTGDTVAALLPRSFFGYVPDGGMQITTVPFDSIILAPSEGYERERPTPIVAGTILLVASRLQTCNFNIYRPKYAKLWVRELDLVNRVAVIRVVIDPNCGYRSLAPGIPQY